MNLAWYVARAAGLVSWTLLAASVLWGLLLATSVLGRNPGPKWLLDVHRFLGGLGVIFVGVHLAGLLADQFVPFSLTQVLVPFTSDYKPTGVAAGVVALYLLLAVEITSLLRTRIPRRGWRAVHLLSYGLFALGTVHLLMSGTDAANPIVRWTVIAVTTVVVIGTVAHVIQRRHQAELKARARTTRPRPPQPTAPSVVPADLRLTGDPGWVLPEVPPTRQPASW